MTVLPEHFGVKKAILDYLTPDTPLVPADYVAEPPHVSTGSFSVGGLGACPRKAYYDRAHKLGLLPFKPAPFEQKALWRMRKGVEVEQLFVLPALKASGRYKNITTQCSLEVEQHELRTKIDFLMDDGGDKVLMELKTCQAKSWDYMKRRKEFSWMDSRTTQPVYAAHWLPHILGKDIQRVQLVVMGYDAFPMIDEWIIDIHEGRISGLGGSGKMFTQPLPPHMTVDGLNEEAVKRLAMWHSHILPPASPVMPRWECDYGCSYADGCKKNLNKNPCQA